MLPSHPQVRRVPGVAGNYPALACRPAQEAGALRRVAPDPLSGITKTLRIYSDAEGSRPLSDHYVDCALGQHPYGRFPWPTDAASAQELRKDVRSCYGLLGMRRAADSEGGPCASRPGRATSFAGACEYEGWPESEGGSRLGYDASAEPR